MRSFCASAVRLISSKVASTLASPGWGGLCIARLRPRVGGVSALTPYTHFVEELVLKRSEHNRLSHSACSHVRGLSPKTSGATAFQSHITGSEETNAAASARSTAT